MPEPNLVVLGAITRPHGVRGEVRVHRFHEASSLILEQRVVWLRKDAVIRKCNVRAGKRSGDADVLHLEGVDTVEAAEALRGFEVTIERQAMPELDEDEHYHVDLLGLDVLEGEIRLGSVLEVVSYPASTAIKVDTHRGILELPLLAPYLVEIDVGARRITVEHSDDFDPES